MSKLSLKTRSEADGPLTPVDREEEASDRYSCIEEGERGGQFKQIGGSGNRNAFKGGLGVRPPPPPPQKKSV